MHFVHRVTTQPRNKPQTKCPGGGQSQGPRGQFLDTVLAAMCPIAMLLTADPGMPPTLCAHAHNTHTNSGNRYMGKYILLIKWSLAMYFVQGSTLSIITKMSHGKALPDSDTYIQIHNQQGPHTPSIP
uniref:Uncharacterized protein n=1 Tax=Mandrillus leucophaeus TaxID=9568 RepID=A0A2K5YNQ5_MANLE